MLQAKSRWTDNKSQNPIPKQFCLESKF